VKITFNTNTPQGAVEDDFETDRPLKELKAQVITSLRLPPAWADQYVVARDDVTLDETKSLSELGVTENATLVVWRVSSTHASRRQSSG
jgi:hypothetical protein